MINDEDLNYPVFEIDEEEAKILKGALTYMEENIDHGGFLCNGVFECRRLGAYGDKWCYLINKVQNSIYPHTALEGYLDFTHGTLLPITRDDRLARRKIWVRKLLEHNGFNNNLKEK